MVNEITPTYYAAGTGTFRSVIKGINFNYWPDEIDVLIADSNNNPLAHLYLEQDKYWFPVVSRSNDEIVTQYPEPITFNGKTYIGAIAIRRTKEVLWVNTTKPIP